MLAQVQTAFDIEGGVRNRGSTWRLLQMLYIGLLLVSQLRTVRFLVHILSSLMCLLLLVGKLCIYTIVSAK